MRMLHNQAWDEVFCAPQVQDTLTRLYGADYSAQGARFDHLLDGFADCYGEGATALFSAPGRTEICGNHTDHQHGCVVAGAVNLDVIAAVRPNDTGVIRIKSEGFTPDCIALDILEPQAAERTHSASIIRGVAARFAQLGYRIGGFDAYTTSNVLKGSGLSSSAAFEVLVGTILSHLYNDGRVSPVQIAQIGQYAENVFFGKPSGLMDQTASSVGSAVYIDFKDTENPIVEKLDLDPARHGYALCIIDTGGDHADLTDEYAAMPNEMCAAAGCFGKRVLREVAQADFLANVKAVREQCGDRSAIRAFHFFEENKRVPALADAIRQDDFDSFLSILRESGRSSYMYLQNVLPVGAVRHQAVALALMLCESVLGARGAYRVHGGGLAGTIQAFVPLELLDEFKRVMEATLGEGKCYVLNIRPVGGAKIAAL